MNPILLFLLSLFAHFTAQYHHPDHLKLEEPPSDLIEKTSDPRRLISAGVTVWQQGIYKVDSITSNFTVSTNTTGNQTLAVNLMLPGDNIAITWLSNHLQMSMEPNLLLRIFSAQGVAITDEIQVAPNEHQLVTSTSMEVMQDGFIVSWAGRTIDMNNITSLNCYRQLFYFNGTKKGSLAIINGLNNDDYSSYPAVATNQNNSEFLFTWTSTPIDMVNLAANGSDSRMQRFSAQPFQKIESDQIVHSYIPEDQIRPMPFYFTNGSFMVLWLDSRSSLVSGEYDMYAHFFNENGNSQYATDYKINGEKVQGMSARERVADLGNDRALVFWIANSLNTSRSSIFYRLIVNGAPLASPTIYEVSPTADYDKYSPGVSLVLDQFVLMYWTSLSAGGAGSLHNITAQLFTKNMTSLGPVFVLESVLGQESFPYIAPTSESGLLLLTWEHVQPGFSIDIFGQVFQLILPTLAPTQTPTMMPTLPTLRPNIVYPVQTYETISSKKALTITLGILGPFALIIICAAISSCIYGCEDAQEVKSSQAHEKRLESTHK